jgi:hypothetical protein
MVRCGYKPSRYISDTEETPATKPKTTTKTKTKKPLTAVTRHHHHKPGPNVIRKAEMRNRERFRRRPSRTIAHNFYNENRLAQRAAGVDTEAPKKPRVKNSPKSEANENFQLAVDNGTPAKVAQLRKEFPEKFDKGGNLKNRKDYSKAPVKKPKKNSIIKKSGLPEYPGINIRESYIHATAERRAVIKEILLRIRGILQIKRSNTHPQATEASCRGARHGGSRPTKTTQRYSGGVQIRFRRRPSGDA